MSDDVIYGEVDSRCSLVVQDLGLVDYYRPHPKVGEGNSFTLLSVHTPGGEYPKVGTPLPPSTCYTAGGMPLAFTQEDFLLKNCFDNQLRPWFLTILNTFT